MGPNHVVVQRWRANHSNGSDLFNLAAMDRLADFNIKEARQQNKSFMNLFVSSFACFIKDYFFPSFNRFRCAFCTGNLGRVDPTTGRDDQDVLEQSFWGTRSEADCLYTTRASRLSGIEFLSMALLANTSLIFAELRYGC